MKKKDLNIISCFLAHHYLHFEVLVGVDKKISFQSSKRMMSMTSMITAPTRRKLIADLSSTRISKRSFQVEAKFHTGPHFPCWTMRSLFTRVISCVLSKKSIQEMRRFELSFSEWCKVFGFLDLVKHSVVVLLSSQQEEWCLWHFWVMSFRVILKLILRVSYDYVSHVMSIKI